MSFISDLLIEISSFRIRVGNKLNTLANRIGDLTALTTSNKTDIVGAINEVNGKTGDFVPYTGATQPLNLGYQDLTSMGVIRKNKEVQRLPNMRVYNNVASWVGSPSNTGFIRINTPIKTNVMFWLKVRIYEYAMRSFSEYIITGYWHLGAIGYNTRVIPTTGNVYIVNVQLGVNGNGELVILMHSENTGWSYPKVIIDEVGYTHSYYAGDSDIEDYSVSITTDDSDFTSNVTIPYNSFIRDRYYLDYNNFINKPTLVNNYLDSIITTNGTTAGTVYTFKRVGLSDLTLTLTAASASFSGVVTTGTQVFAGVKRFESGSVLLGNGTEALYSRIQFGNLDLIPGNGRRFLFHAGYYFGAGSRSIGMSQQAENGAEISTLTMSDTHAVFRLAGVNYNLATETWANNRFYKTQIGGTYDMNLEYRNGTGQYTTSTVNAPSSYGIFQNIVSIGGDHNNSNNWIAQYTYETGSENNIYYRFKTNNAAWSNRVKFYHTGNFNPAQYVLQSSLNTQLNNYATKAGTQTFTGQNTFTQAIYTPAATLNGHAVNLGQLNNILSGYATIENVAYHNDGYNVNSNVDWGTNVLAGARNQVQGGRNIVKGDDINIFGSRNISSGINNQINGFANVVNGAFNTLTGAYSSIAGSQANVIGNYLFARDKQTVLGMYNKVYDLGDDEGLRFAFGTGMNDLDKHNAVEIYDDHRTEFHGKAQYNEETRNPEWFTEDYTHVDTYQVGYDHLPHRAQGSTPCEANILRLAVRYGSNSASDDDRFTNISDLKRAFNVHGIVDGSMTDSTINVNRIHTKGTLEFSTTTTTKLISDAKIESNNLLIVRYNFGKGIIDIIGYTDSASLLSHKADPRSVTVLLGSFILKKNDLGQPVAFFEFNQQII